MNQILQSLIGYMGYINTIAVIAVCHLKVQWLHHTDIVLMFCTYRKTLDDSPLPWTSNEKFNGQHAQADNENKLKQPPDAKCTSVAFQKCENSLISFYILDPMLMWDLKCTVCFWVFLFVLGGFFSLKVSSMAVLPGTITKVRWFGPSCDFKGFPL